MPSIEVTLGPLAAIDPDHLKEHFLIASTGTLAEGAELKITAVDDVQSGDPAAVVLESVEIQTN